MQGMSAPTQLRGTLIAGVITYLLIVAVFALVVIRSTDETVNPAVTALGLTGLLVVTAAFAAPFLLTRFSIEVRSWVAYLIAGLTAVLSIGPWLLTATGNTVFATAIYQGLRIPQGPVQFWDLDLVLQSVDCAQAGVDVYAANNGCLADPSIYAPGTLWLGYFPGDIFSSRNSVWLGVIALIISTVMIFWIARNSTARGQLALLVSVLGASWLLILERGNFDLFVIWVAVFSVAVVRRWPYLWAWSIAAALIWLAGTWKYYPFAMGVMLLPLLFIRRGWIVLLGFVVASAGFVFLTWQNFQYSVNTNAGMVDLGDFVVLGRIPLVARMFGASAEGATYALPDLLVVVMAIAAAVWGVLWMWTRKESGVVGLGSGLRYPAMLAAAGSTLFLISVLVSGFGYAYKAAFLLLVIPLLSRPVRTSSPRIYMPSLIMLILVVIGCVVVWNTALATVSGIVAAAFALGAAGVVLKQPMLRSIQQSIYR